MAVKKKASPKGHTSSESCEIFHRLTLRQRGHLTNVATLSPLQQIEISSSGITFPWSYLWLRRLHERRYDWSQLTSARVVRRRRWKAYGRGAGAWIWQRILHLSTVDAKWTVDISGQFPDFANSREILAAINKHIAVDLTADEGPGREWRARELE